MGRNLLSRGRVVVILSSDFAFLRANHTFELRDQSHFFADLYGLRAAPGAEFIEEATGVSFDSVFADEEFVGDLAIAETLRDQLQDFQLASGDTEVFQSLLVEGERLCNGHRNFLNDEHFLLFSQFQPEPDTETGEKGGDDPAIDLERVLDNQKAKLDQPEHDDQNPAAQAIDERMYERLSVHVKSDFTTIRVIRG